MPGLPLARQVIECYEGNPGLEAIVSRSHGIFTFAEDAETSYSRMIEYVSRAESFIEERTRSAVSPARPGSAGPVRTSSAAARLVQVLRGACAHRDSEGRLRRFVAELRTAPDIVEISRSGLARELCRSGVLTPDHVTRTKNRMLFVDRVPETDGDLRAHVGELVAAYCEEYDRTFDEQVKARKVDRRKLDPFPRLILAAGVGLVALGATRKAARVAADIGEATLRAKRLACELGSYAPIADSHVFDMEYWSLQQKKLGAEVAPPLAGQVAFVTGAGGAIGAGVAERLLAAGALVAISDIDEERLCRVHEHLAERNEASRIESIVCDVTSLRSVERAFEEVSCRAGGIDILVPNAGIAHVATLEALEPEKLGQVVAVNLMGTFNTIKAAIPVLRRQATGGNIVLISSKNVPDPGAAFGAYSASKAAAHQICEDRRARAGGARRAGQHGEPRRRLRRREDLLGPVGPDRARPDEVARARSRRAPRVLPPAEPAQGLGSGASTWATPWSSSRASRPPPPGRAFRWTAACPRRFRGSERRAAESCV